MKLKLTGKNKRTAGIVLASALVIGSLGTVAAFAANSSDAVPKNTVVTVPAASNLQKTSTAAQGTIQYSKDVYSRADGSQNFTSERWYNPETKEWRSDLIEYNTNHQITKYQSSYLANGGSDLITIQRNVNGKPISGTIFNLAKQPDLAKKFNMTRDFNSIKEYVTGSSWTSIGTVQTSDGKTLNKVMESYKSYINDTTQANIQLIDYIDENTGLPVKDELYEDSTGKYKLFSSDTFDYKYVSDNGNIFNTSGVTLTPVNGLGNASQK